MQIVVPLPRAGLTMPDLALRLYRDGVPDGLGASATLSALGGTTYRIGNLPDAPGPWAVSWEVDGQGGAHEWGWSEPVEGVLLPVREAGLVAGDFALELYRDGAPASGVDLAVEETEDGGGYFASGWAPASTGAAWVLLWTYGGVTYPRSWREPWAPVTTGLAPETVVRRIVAGHWLRNWLGPALDEKRICPARALGFGGEEISFSPDDPVDVAPWTPAETRATAGFALLRLREINRFDDGVTAGAEVIAGQERIVSGEYRLYRAEFEVVLPSKPAGVDPVEAAEERRAEIEALFEGFAVLPAEGPVLSIRQLARYPTQRRGSFDDGTWRRSYLDVQLRARVRKIHAGTQEVALS